MTAHLRDAVGFVCLPFLYFPGISSLFPIWLSEMLEK